MKKKRWTALLAFALAALIPAVLAGAGLLLPKVYADTYYAELAPMVDRMRNARGKRLIVLGNSDVAFGLDGAALEAFLAQKGFDYAVCPFGLYGAVGSSAMLSLAQKELREGDLVVLVAEPVSETLSPYFGASAFLKCAESAPWLMTGVNASQSAALWGAAIPFVQEKIAIWASGEAPRAEGVYALASFNDRCDMVYDRPGNLMPLGYDPAKLIDLGGVTMDGDFAAQVRDFCRHAARRGARVCLSFSPMNASALVDGGEEAVNAFFTAVYDSVPCPVISDPNRYILDSAWFYDSNFHLNTPGAAVRTYLLAQDLLAYLGCYTRVAFDLPSAPPSAAPALPEGEDNGDFLFAPTADGLGFLVDGVSGQGLEKDSLAVPPLHEGKPVVGFASGALDRARQVRELTVPAAVAELPSGLFACCPQLERLIFTARSSPCQVYPDSFAGADRLRVLVPAADYVLYRDGVGCESNPWAQFLDRVVKY